MTNPAGVQRMRSTRAAMSVALLRAVRARVPGAIKGLPATAEILYERFMMGLNG